MGIDILPSVILPPVKGVVVTEMIMELAHLEKGRKAAHLLQEILCVPFAAGIDHIASGSVGRGIDRATDG